MFTIRRVLELGAGGYSTPTFLNRSVFSDLIHLQSIETDPTWLTKISDKAEGDSRLKLTLVEKPLWRAVKDLDIVPFDLIFIDDSTSVLERAATIREIANKGSGKNIVVIHDFEIDEYRRAARLFPHRVAFEAFIPMTGVVWSSFPANGRALKRLNSLIARHSRLLAPESVTDWAEIISRNRSCF